MACSYDGTTATGVCENAPEEFGTEKYKEWLAAIPASGSEFAGWLVLRGEEFNEAEYGCLEGSCEGFTEFCPATENLGLHGPDPISECGFASHAPGELSEFEVQATFCAEGTAIEEVGYNAYWEVDETLLLGCGSPNPTKELSVEVEGPGEVSGPNGLLCPSTSCAANIDEGETVTLTATPAAHAHFVEWTGADAGSCSGQSTSTCEVEMSDAKTVKAVFADTTHTLTVAPTGSGEVNGGPISGCTEGGGTCSGSVVEGQSATLIASPEPGWAVAGWTGCSNTSGNSCEVTVNGDATVEVDFVEITGAMLTVYVTGGGSVSADSGTVTGCTDAGGPACEGTYEGTATLTETSTPGYVFAGWIGCKHKNATQCEVAVTAEREVYAVFIGEGAAGAPGEDGKNIIIGTATGAECPEGGITVEVEGEPSTKQAICDGHIGQDGERGEIGFPGPEGPPGPQGGLGPAGPSGQSGAVGLPGPQGIQGPRGARGQRGPAGKVKVTCTLKGGKRVTCKVHSVGSSRAGRKSAKLSWRLMKDGRTQRHGKTTLGRLSRILEHLRAGRYVLRIDGHRSTVVIPGGRHS
jgi:hypothetical protein